MVNKVSCYWHDLFVVFICVVGVFTTMTLLFNVYGTLFV
jgi:hypothetical protein